WAGGVTPEVLWMLGPAGLDTPDSLTPSPPARPPSRRFAGGGDLGVRRGGGPSLRLARPEPSRQPSLKALRGRRLSGDAQWLGRGGATSGPRRRPHRRPTQRRAWPRGSAQLAVRCFWPAVHRRSGHVLLHCRARLA